MSDRQDQMSVQTNVAAFALSTARERTAETHAMVEARAEREAEQEKLEATDSQDRETQISLSAEGEAALVQNGEAAAPSTAQDTSEVVHAVNIVV